MNTNRDFLLSYGAEKDGDFFFATFRAKRMIELWKISENDQECQECQECERIAKYDNREELERYQEGELNLTISRKPLRFNQQNRWFVILSSHGLEPIILCNNDDNMVRCNLPNRLENVSGHAEFLADGRTLAIMEKGKATVHLVAITNWPTYLKPRDENMISNYNHRRENRFKPVNHDQIKCEGNASLAFILSRGESYLFLPRYGNSILEMYDISTRMSYSHIVDESIERGKVQISLDGSLLAFSGKHIVERQTGLCIAKHNEGSEYFRFVHNDWHLLKVGIDGTCTLIDARSGTVLASVKIQDLDCSKLVESKMGLKAITYNEKENKLKSKEWHWKTAFCEPTWSDIKDTLSDFEESEVTPTDVSIQMQSEDLMDRHVEKLKSLIKPDEKLIRKTSSAIFLRRSAKSSVHLIAPRLG